MKNKVNDIPYLCCNEELIKDSTPNIDMDMLKHYYNYVTERYEIFKKREKGFPPPWTNDPILKEYKFTNVRREHDRTTKWLIDNISKSEKLSDGDMFWRTMIFRLYNKIETAELIELGDYNSNFWNNIEDYANRLDKQETDVYTRAYKTVSIKYRHKYKYPNHDYRSSMLLFISDKAKDNNYSIPDGIMDNANKLFKYFISYSGIGYFLGYQLFVDMTYLPESVCPISENEFVVAGPGCKAGIDRLFIDRDCMSYEESLFWIRDNFNSMMRNINPNYDQKLMLDNLPEYDRHMNVMSIENTFCEFSKYCWSVLDIGSPRRKYVYER